VNKIYHPYNFNPLFWHLRKYLRDPKIRYIYVYGGSSAAKTYTLVQCLQIEQELDPFNLMVFRKESTTIDDTIYNDFKEIAPSLQLDVVPLEKEIRARNKKYTTVFKGLDNPEKIKGLSGFLVVYANEASSLEYIDHEEIRRRLRGRPGQKIIYDWNPIDEDHWLKKDVIDKVVDDVPTEEWFDLPLHVDDAPTKFTQLDPEHSFVRINKAGDSILIRTTYRDNFWVVGHPADKRYGFRDEHQINTLEGYKRYKNSLFYDVYTNGEWGKIKHGTEFFDEFEKSVHVVNYCMYDETKAVFLSFDFNRKPYSTCLPIQLEYDDDGKTIVNVFDEVCLKPPNNTITHIREKIEHDHPWISEIYFTGDPSGRSKGQRKHRDEADSYEDAIISEFDKYIHNKSNIFPRVAPPLAKRQMAMADVLRGKTCLLRVHKKCTNLINDFETLQVDKTGGYIKKKVTDKATGGTYEQGGHCADALIYFLGVEFPKEFYPK
jgi:phage terminase large subunit